MNNTRLSLSILEIKIFNFLSQKQILNIKYLQVIREKKSDEEINMETEIFKS